MVACPNGSVAKVAVLAITSSLLKQFFTCAHVSSLGC